MNRIGLSGFGNEGDLRRGVTERTRGIFLNLRIGPIAVDFAEIGSYGRLKRQSHVGLIGGNPVLVVLTETGPPKVATDTVERRSRGPEILGYVHEHVRLLPLQENVQDVVAQDSVERALRALGGMMWIVAYDLESFAAQKIYVCSVSTAVVQNAPLDVTEAEKLSRREGRTVSLLGSKMRIGIFAIRHGKRKKRESEVR
jgi:hypothetical protein